MPAQILVCRKARRSPGALSLLTPYSQGSSPLPARILPTRACYLDFSPHPYITSAGLSWGLCKGALVGCSETLHEVLERGAEAGTRASTWLLTSSFFPTRPPWPPPGQLLPVSLPSSCRQGKGHWWSSRTDERCWGGRERAQELGVSTCTQPSLIPKHPQVYPSRPSKYCHDHCRVQAALYHLAFAVSCQAGWLRIAKSGPKRPEHHLRAPSLLYTHPQQKALGSWLGSAVRGTHTGD